MLGHDVLPRQSHILVLPSVYAARKAQPCCKLLGTQAPNCATGSDSLAADLDTDAARLPLRAMLHVFTMLGYSIYAILRYVAMRKPRPSLEHV